MGQFKPMVKMMTTEPSVELKLKKGGSVEKKMQTGGMPDMAAEERLPMPARGGMMPAKRPMRPSLMARRRAMRGMPTGAGPAAPVGEAARMAEATAPAQVPATTPMKKGGKAESAKEHAAEMKQMSQTAKKLKEHADKPASKAHKGLKTGGVVMGQGGYKTGGVVKGQGGYKTGGVVMGQGGYKDGGDVKKPKATGNVDDSGAPVAMPQGKKTPPSPVYVRQLAGTYKKGGKVTPAEGRLQKMFKKENAPAMKAAKADSNEKYAKGGALMTPKIGSVTETEKSVTVTPAKRGGAMRRPC